MMKPGLQGDCSQAENLWGLRVDNPAGELETQRKGGGEIGREEARREKRAGRFAALGQSLLLSGTEPQFLQVPH